MNTQAMSKSIGILRMEDLTGQITDDHLYVEALQNLGCTVSELAWTSDSKWSDFDAIIIRATWDYHLRLDEFLTKLKEIQSQTILLNPLEVVEWNANKKYLQELTNQGCSIVPTIFETSLTEEKLNHAFDKIAKDKIIVKPTVSANSLDTIITERGNTHVLEVFKDRECMIQPYIHNINTIGEYSVYYFDGEFSHSIIKKPAKGDFRVQEDFGGTQEEIQVNEELLACTDKVLAHFPKNTFYGRVDVVLSDENEYQVMELELIEPGMYFRFCEGSAENFAYKTIEYLNKIS